MDWNSTYEQVQVSSDALNQRSYVFVFLYTKADLWDEIKFKLRTKFVHEPGNLRITVPLIIGTLFELDDNKKMRTSSNPAGHSYKTEFPSSWYIYSVLLQQPLQQLNDTFAVPFSYYYFHLFQILFKSANLKKERDPAKNKLFYDDIFNMASLNRPCLTGVK